MGEQLVGEPAERVDEPAAGGGGVLGVERLGGADDPLGALGDASMIGLEPVDDRPELGVGAAQGGEDEPVLVGVVGVDEAAVVEAAEAQPPQRAGAAQLLDRLAQFGGGGAGPRRVG